MDQKKLLNYCLEHERRKRCVSSLLDACQKAYKDALYLTDNDCYLKYRWLHNFENKPVYINGIYKIYESICKKYYRDIYHTQINLFDGKKGIAYEEWGPYFHSKLIPFLAKEKLVVVCVLCLAGYLDGLEHINFKHSMSELDYLLNDNESGYRFPEHDE